jgi:hypothetical protein
MAGALVGAAILSLLGAYNPAILGGASGTVLYGQGVNTVPIWSTLTLPNAATTGDILYATGTNAIGRLAAPAIGEIIESQGTSTEPIWTRSLQLGTTASAGQITMYGGTSGDAVVSVPSAAATPAVVLPTVNTTFPTAQPGTSGMAEVSTTAGARSFIAEQGTLAWSSLTGAMTTSAILEAVMPNAGHFTRLVCCPTLTGTCTTSEPEYNVKDVTASTTGTATTGLGTTVGTCVSEAETLTFSAGDTVGIFVSTAESSCTAPIYGCVATYTQP